MSEALKLLAIDTSTDACVVAVANGANVVERSELVPRQHNRLLLPMVIELLEETALDPGALDLIVMGRGPGSFTGIRIATGVAQGLAFGLGIPVAPVSTLACMAQGRFVRYGDTSIAVAMQARQEEVYWGCYAVEDGVAEPRIPDCLVQCGDARVEGRGPWVGVGDGWCHRGRLEAALALKMVEVEESVHPRGSDLLTLGRHCHERGESVSAIEAAPAYLRERVAARITERDG